MLKQTEIKREMQKRRKKIAMFGKKMEFIMTESKINTSEAQQFHKDESKSVFKSPRKLTLIIFYFIRSAHIHLQEPVIISLT